MLGLADQVGGHLGGHRAVVGQDGDLGRPGLGVDPDPALEQALGGGHVDVARPCDQVHGRALGGAVGEHRDRLGAADRVHLGDAQQRAGRQDRRVHLAVAVLLRRGGDRDALDATLLGGDHVHHNGGRVDGQAARHVEADPVHRHPALADRAARHHLGGVVGAALLAVDQAGPADRFLQGGADLRVQRRERGGDLRLGHPGTREADPVEALGELDQRLDPAMAYVLADRPHLLQGGLHVELGTGQQVAWVAGGATQVDSRDHRPKCKECPE